MRTMVAMRLAALMAVSGACAPLRVAPDGIGSAQSASHSIDDGRLGDADRVRAVRDHTHRKSVDREIDRVHGLRDLLSAAEWVPAHDREPGTYEGRARPGGIESILASDGGFGRGQPAAVHRRRLGHDAIEFRRFSDLVQPRSLHVVVSPTSGRFEVHVDKFSPYDTPFLALLHWLFDVIPSK